MVSSLFAGADTGALRALAHRMTGAAQRLTSMSSAATRGLADTPWYGRDADLCRADWQQRCRPALATVAASLDRAAASLLRQAQQQDDASAAAGSGAGSPGAGSPGAGSSGTGAGVGAARGAGSAWAAAAERAWDTWQRWYGRLAAAVDVTPFVATAIRWPDAPRIGPHTWTQLADAWSDTHLPTTGLGRTLSALNLASFGADVYQTTTAAMDGDVLGALEHGIPAALAAGSAAPNPWIALPSMAGSAGWTVGSWIYDEYALQIGDGIDATIAGIEEFNSSPVGIWVGDHVVGPTGDALVGAWDALADALSGSDGTAVNTQEDAR